MENNNILQIESGIYNKDDINLEKIIQSIKQHPRIDEVGSILSFTGIVRSSSSEGKPVKSMKIDAYKELANKIINRICEDIKKREGIIEIKIIHFQGNFDISEDLVHVVVASSHRAEGFNALRSAVEMYKKKITVWKKEEYSDGTSEWIH